MKAIVDLFSTDYGLFSVAVIVFTIFMGFWFSRYFKRKMDEDAARAQRDIARDQPEETADRQHHRQDQQRFRQSFRDHDPGRDVGDR